MKSRKKENEEFRFNYVVRAAGAAGIVLVGDLMCIVDLPFEEGYGICRSV